MNKLLVSLVLVCACSCGQDVDCTFTARGLCVDTNGYDIVQENLVAQTIETVEYAFERFYADVNFSRLLEEKEVTAQYVKEKRFAKDICEHISDKQCIKNKEYTVGYYQPSDSRRLYPNIEVVKYDFDLIYSECFYAYFVLGHELLHAAEDIVLRAPNKQEVNHTTPNLFLIWADNNNKSYKEVAEFYVALDVKDMCNELYPKPPKE